MDDETKQNGELNRQKCAEVFDLPPDATWDDIDASYDDWNRRRSAENLGLPSTSTWGEIAAKFEDEKNRLKCAESLNLPATASWEEITAAYDRRFSQFNAGGESQVFEVLSPDVAEQRRQKLYGGFSS